ncbi:hypothetical protein [Variovorax gossypii]
MSTEITFPLALCKAQWSIWLHTLEMLETIGSHALQRGIEETRAETDAVMRADDWQALALTPLHAFWPDATVGQQRERASCVQTGSGAAQAHAADAPASRGDVVHDALCTLHTALAAAPAPRRSRPRAPVAAGRRKT